MPNITKKTAPAPDVSSMPSQSLPEHVVVANAPAPVAPKSKKVEIDRETLQGILASLEKLKQDNEKLTYAADKGRLANWEEQHKAEKKKSVRLTAYKGEDGKEKIVTGWKTLADRWIRDPHTNIVTGEYHESEIQFDDQSTMRIVGYPAFMEFMYGTNDGRTRKITAMVVSERVMSDSSRVFDLELSGGRTLTLHERFVN